MCGVCEGHSYMSNSYCYSCAADSLDSKGFRLAVYMLVPVAVMCFLSAVLFVNMLATPTLKKEGAGDAEQDVFISNDLIYDMAGSKHERGDTAARARGPRPEEVVAVEMTETNKQREEEDEGSRDSSARVNASGRASSSTARNIKRPSGRLGDILQRNKNNFKKLIRGGSITGKITISFLQVRCPAHHSITVYTQCAPRSPDLSLSVCLSVPLPHSLNTPTISLLSVLL